MRHIGEASSPVIEQMETTEPRTVGARFNLDRMQFLQDHGSGCPEREVSAKPTGQASVSHEQEGNKLVDAVVESRINFENQTSFHFSNTCFSSSSPYFQICMSSIDVMYSYLTQSADASPREERLPLEASSPTANVPKDQGEPPPWKFL